MYKYIIAGDISEITPIMEPIIADRRFMSDSKNVADFAWYPISEFMQGVDLYLTSPVTDEDLFLLTGNYNSLTIAVCNTKNDSEISYSIAEGQVLND